MKNPIEANYGSWTSPLTIDKLLAESVILGGVKVKPDGQIFFVESRPSDSGRTVLCQLSQGDKVDLLPTPYSMQTRVHEYGGSAISLKEDICYFSNFTDQKIYKMSLGEDPTPLTSNKKYRYADFSLSSNNKSLYAVLEDHSKSDINAVNSIAKIDTENGKINIVQSGYDFYSSPRLSHDNKKIAYLCWNHPNMPWDENELWIADVNADGTLSNSVKIAGGNENSIFQPEWANDGTLYYADDKTGYWNLYQYKNNSARCLHELKAEFGRPQWRFGDSTYKLIDNETILCTFRDNEKWNLATLDISSGKLSEFKTPFTNFLSLNIHSGFAFFVGSSPTELPSIIKLNLSNGDLERIYTPNQPPLPQSYISKPELIEFPTENNKTAFAFYYSPNNPEFKAPDGELPPLIVMSHGGPTACSEHTLSIKNSAPTQYWTTRGFAVLDVNYGGSSGYGREYRKRLNQNWGIVDKQDCDNAAKYLIKLNKVDKNKVAIRGGSAGGYCTLCALVFTNTFSAGASFFGVSDLEALAKETHKFESRYMDGLVGSYPEMKQTYYERSPINFTSQLSCPVIFFQGLEDRVVPPNQAEEMYKILLEKNLPTAYVPYEGEQHGFKKAENIKHSLECELYFYSKIFNLTPADKLQKIEIKNLD